MASAAPCANHLHLAPDRTQHSDFTGRMPFLLPNQQCQSTEGALIRVIQLEYQQDVVHQNRRVPGLPCGVVCDFA